MEYRSLALPVWRVLFVLLPLFCLPAPATADGLSWLGAQAQPDGRIVSSVDIATDLQATAESLRALTAVGLADPTTRGAALQYLKVHSQDTTEAIARQVVFRSKRVNPPPSG